MIHKIKVLACFMSDLKIFSSVMHLSTVNGQCKKKAKKKVHKIEIQNERKKKYNFLTNSIITNIHPHTKHNIFETSNAIER